MAFGLRRQRKELLPVANTPPVALARAVAPELPVLCLGSDWVVVVDLRSPDALTVTTAAIGERGTVAIATIADPAPVVVRGGKPYCGTGTLEPAIASVLKAARSLADALRGPLDGKPVVHAALVALGVDAPFKHLDVLVTSPADLALGLLTYPVVHGPNQVSTSVSVLRGMAGHTVPRSFPGRAPRERSADEIASIKARPAPPPTPQPWRQWSPGGGRRPLQGAGDDHYGKEPNRHNRAGTSFAPKMKAPRVRSRRRAFLFGTAFGLALAVVALVGLAYLGSQVKQPGATAPATSVTQAPGMSNATVLYLDARTVMLRVADFHVEGRLQDGTTNLGLDLDVSQEGGGGTIDLHGASLHIVTTTSRAYVMADQASWQKLSVPAATAEIVANRWIRVGAADHNLTPFTWLAVSTQLVDGLLAQNGYLGFSHAPAPVSWRGHSATVLGSPGRSLYVASTGLPYVLALRAASGPDSGELNFSGFGTTPPPTPPVKSLTVPGV